MHILLIHQAFAALNEPGGTRHHELARHLAQRGHRVTVIASPVSYLTGAPGGRIPWVQRQEGGPGVSILRAYTYPAQHRSFVHRVFGFLSFMLSSFIIGLSVKDIDLVWGTSPPIFQGATAWALARLKRAPFLFEVRDLWPAFAVAVGVLRHPLLIRASEWLERFLYRHADRLMVNSPGFIEHIRAHGGQEISLVPNGADIDMFDPQADGSGFRRTHGLEGKFVAMYAGAHGMSNDLDVVLRAAAQLQAVAQHEAAVQPQVEAEIAVVLLGDGKEKAALKTQADVLGLRNVLFLPPVPKNEMSKALAAADACIAILKPVEMYKTVYPNKVFDYMAAGRPIALAIGGVIQDVVEKAACGIIVPPGDAGALAQAILSLAQDRPKAARMGLAGRAYLEAHFDRSRLADKLASLLEEMVG